MNYANIRILLVEDNPGDARLIREMLKEAGRFSFELECLGRLDESIGRLERGNIDVVLLDLSLPDSHGLDTFLRLKQLGREPPILLLTGLSDEKLAVEAVRCGAQDYLVKGQIDANLLVRAILYALERKRYERAVAAEKKRLEITLASIGDGVIAVDADGKINLMNGVAEELTGWKFSEASGKPFTEVFKIVNSSDNKPQENLFEKAVKTGDVTFLPLDSILISQNGSELFIEDSVAPLRDMDNKIIGVVVVFRDVTEKRKIEAEAMKVQKLEALSVMAGGLAHDFNNIMTAILNNIAYVKCNLDPNLPVNEVLTEAEQAVIKAKSLTNQLVTFSKGGILTKRSVYLTDIVKEQVKFALRGSRVSYKIFAKNDLHPVEVDTGQFNQIIDNLVINSLQAMPSGGTIEIRLENIEGGKGKFSFLRNDRYVGITVHDEGVGIPEKHLTKIFDPYFSTKSTGSGLGLAVTYSIIKRHHGEIRVESKPGTGTTVSVYLPASQVIPDKERKYSGEIVTGKGRILVMDDEEIVLRSLGHLIKYIGYDVEFSRNGTEALDLYKKNKDAGTPFTLLIMDLTIPGGMGGKDTLREIIKIDPKVKAIVSSGYCDDPVMANYREYGFKGMLPKPYNVIDLSEVINRIISES